MTRDEFIERAAALGYSSKACAKKYAGKRTEFTESDFEDLYRSAERETYLSDLYDTGLRTYAHASHKVWPTGRTSKDYSNKQ